MHRYLFVLVYLIPLSTFFSIISSGSLTYISPMIVFILLPILEFLLPPLNSNYDEKTSNSESNNRYYDYLAYSIVPTQYLLLGFFLYSVQNNIFSSFELFGIIFSMGISCGVLGINVAHELGHRVSKQEQLMAKLLLITSCYSHFFVEHNKGHHRHVSTPKDPASAKLNQNLFSFWFISMFGSLNSAINLDRNQVFIWKLIETGLVITITIVFGAKAALCFLAAALIGALLLESVNYIEHYGLQRKTLPNGRFEKVTPQHSWNSDHPIGRLVLFNLSRHSDHHANINRKYQVLRSFQKDSPQYPTGYPGMILLSLVPPLWYRIMNKEVKRWEDSRKV